MSELTSLAEIDIAANFSIGKKPSQEVEKTPVVSSAEKYKSSIEDEWNKPSVTVDILNTVDLNNSNLDIQMAQELSKLFENNNIETDSTRAQSLTEIAQKMSAQKDKKVRVWILQKGSQPMAAAFPDGTIIVNYKLINLLDNMDELAAVLAHEVSHLDNSSFTNINSASNLEAIGVGWVHEAASDLSTPRKLEKAGFNSEAFMSAILKISSQSDERDFSHQSSGMRAVEVKLMNTKLDSNSSHFELTEKSPAFNNLEINLTNLEIADQALANQDLELMKQVIVKLSVKDLKNFKSFLSKVNFRQLGKLLQGVNQSDPKYNQLTSERREFLLQTFKFLDQEVLIERVKTEENASQDQAKTLFLLNESAGYDKLLQPWNAFSSVEEIIAAIGQINFWANKIENESLSRTAKDVFSLELNVNTWTKLFSQETGSKSNLGEKSSLYQALENGYFYGLDLNQEGKFVVSPSALEKLLLATEQFLPTQSEFWEKVLLTYIKTYSTSTFSNEEWQSLFSFLKTKPEIFNQKTAKKIEMPLQLQKLWQITFSDGEKKVENQAEKRSWEEIIKEWTDSLVEKLKLYETIGLDFRYVNRLTELLIVQESFSEEMKTYAYEKLKEKIISLPFTASGRILDLENFNDKNQGYNYQEQSAEKLAEFAAENKLVFNFKLTLHFLQTLFDENSVVYQQSLNNLINESGLDWEKYNWQQSYYLLSTLTSFNRSRLPNSTGLEQINFSPLKGGESQLKEGKNIYLNRDLIKDRESLPGISALLDKMDAEYQEQTSLKSLNNYIGEKSLFLSRINNNGYHSTSNVDFFDADDWERVMFWRNERANLLKLLDNLDRYIADPTQIPDFLKLIESLFRDDQTLATASKNLLTIYLREKTIPFAQRQAVFIEYFNKIGKEGAEILASEIQTISQYQEFRSSFSDLEKRYLAGNQFASKLAGIDFLSSKLANNFEKVFATVVDDHGESSRDFAEEWLNQYRSKINLKLNKVSPDLYNYGSNIESFRSVNDWFEGLQNLNENNRTLLVNKLLNDQNGALASRENREKLVNLINKTDLGGDDFIRELINILIKNARSDVISLPLISFFSPLIFKKYNLDDLAPERGKNSDEQERFSKYAQILAASTDEIVLFSNKFLEVPDSTVALESQKSGFAKKEVRKRLSEQSALLAGKETEKKPETKDASQMETMVAALESGGAIMVRQLQLASQFFPLNQEWRERLSKTLDSNEGMTKLEMWENLYYWAYEATVHNEKEATQQTELRNLLETSEIFGKVGGGSLNTIYEMQREGEAEKFVLRVQNPNVHARVKEMHSLLDTTYSTMMADKNVAKMAKMGAMVNDLAQRWCLSDINDPSYVEDDAKFRQVMSGFQSQEQNFQLNIPQLEFTQSKVKVEQKAKGRTINQLLKDSEISELVKTRLKRFFVELFQYQLDFEKNKMVDENGKEYILVHSDQHLGNYMADVDAQTAEINFSIIDRNMYLRLERGDVEVIRTLLDKGGLTFLKSLTKRILEVNKVKNRIEKARLSSKIEGKIIIEALKDLVNGRTSDQMQQLQLIFEQFALNNLDVPLNMQMMIRNSAAYQGVLSDLK